ncbi:MAG: hypothetical protein ACREAY_04285 [Nitrososphaera sp.]|uniref:hypothetical protein n=1 Tax=Nitrososphaera sp. TaxID=1971748 RepID=UPI003D6E63AB
MNKNAMLAVALAAFLAMSAAPFAGAGAAWADGDDNKDEKRGKIRDRLATFIKDRNNDDGERRVAELSFGTVKVSAKGLAVEKGDGAVKVSDATLALTGSVFKNSGNHSKLFVNGTLDFGGDRYVVRAEGNFRLNDRLDFGHVGIHGKILKENERKDYAFHAKAIALPPQNDGLSWKLVGEQPAQAGRAAKIYALAGEIKLERALAPAPTPDNTGLDRFLISRIGSQAAGGEFTFAVTAIDSLGRVKTAYTGTVALSTNNGASPAGHASIILASYTFTAADAGQHVFAAKMFNARSDSVITVSGDSRTATSNVFAVAPAQASSVTVTPSSATLGPGGVVSLAAKAQDAYGNQMAGATYAWALGAPSLGTLAPSASTAAFTAASLAAPASGIVSVTAALGGATASGSATVNVNPA